MEFNLKFELDLVWSERKRLEKLILNKYLSQLQKIFISFREDYFRELPSRRFYPNSSKYILLYKFININGFILVTIDGEEEKFFVDNLYRFLNIQTYLSQYIFQLHSNKLKKFDRKKNIKVSIQLKGDKKRGDLEPLRFI